MKNVDVYKLLDILPGFLAGILVLGFICYALILSTERDPGTVLYNGTIDMTDTQKTHEAVIIYMIDRTKLCHLKIMGSIFDSKGIRHTLPIYELTAKQLRGTLGNRMYLKYTIPFPIMPNGSARYETSREYVCNWTHNIAPITVDDPIINFNNTVGY